MRILLIILLAAGIGGGVAYAWVYYGGFAGEKGTSIAFIDSYSEYDEIATEVEALVHLPGVGENADRAELLSLLNSILTETMSGTQRESLARIAFTHLDTIKKEIDAAQTAQARLYAVLQDFDNASRVFHGIELRRKADAIVALARKRAELSSRITSVLSETSEQTYAIVTRILADQGSLTQEHIIEINNATAEAEKRFATLEDLYQDLTLKKTELDAAFTDFAETAI